MGSMLPYMAAPWIRHGLLPAPHFSGGSRSCLVEVSALSRLLGVSGGRMEWCRQRLWLTPVEWRSDMEAPFFSEANKEPDGQVVNHLNLIYLYIYICVFFLAGHRCVSRCGSFSQLYIYICIQLYYNYNVCIWSQCIHNYLHITTKLQHILNGETTLV